MPVVPTSAHGHKPAAAMSPPAPASNRDDTYALCRALGNSAFMTDAQVISKAAGDLQQMIGRFLEEHSTLSMVRDLRRAGLLTRGRESYVTGIAANVLKDLAGLAWCLEAATTLVDGELFEAPSVESEEGSSNG